MWYQRMRCSAPFQCLRIRIVLALHTITTTNYVSWAMQRVLTWLQSRNISIWIYLAAGSYESYPYIQRVYVWNKSWRKMREQASLYVRCTMTTSFLCSADDDWYYCLLSQGKHLMQPHYSKPPRKLSISLLFIRSFTNCQSKAQLCPSIKNSLSETD